MRRLALLLAFGAGVSVSLAEGQAPASADFDAFRRRALSEFSTFRNDALSDYAKFLDAAWEEFDSFKAEARNPKPKPVTPPPLPAAKPEPVKIPAPEPPAPVAPAKPRPATPAAPAAPAAAPTGEKIDWYGLSVDVPHTMMHLRGRLADGSAFAAQWREYLATPAAAELSKQLGAVTSGLGLNDYLTFDFIRKYVDQKFPAAHSSAKASLTHFLMTSLGYDVRIALSGSEGVLLVPSVQTIYGKPYMMMDGKKFYVFADALDASGRISTCRLPQEAATGRAIDMHISNRLSIPTAPRDFELKFGKISLKGQVNENIYPILYRYPQTDMEVYATSVIDDELRADLVGQLKSQLAGMSQLDAVNTLLEFTQKAIEYATDDTAHGFEKPYFLEEWLYYPRNDCEDRAVFYTYMLWNALGVECQLITYPGHESVAVCLDEPIQGDNYSLSGRTFYISDPTYIGAVTGMCMPDFRQTAPEIEYHFHK